MSILDVSAALATHQAKAGSPFTVQPHPDGESWSVMRKGRAVLTIRSLDDARRICETANYGYREGYKAHLLQSGGEG